MTRPAARCASTSRRPERRGRLSPRQRRLVRPGDHARRLLRERHRARGQRGRRDGAGPGWRHARATCGPDDSTRRRAPRRRASWPTRQTANDGGRSASGWPRLADGHACSPGTDSRRGLAGHLATFGSVAAPDDLVELVEAAGLKGRGGAAFPTAAKLAVVAARRGAVVVANGAEGEPASRKDRALLRVAPHLVLDGAALAAGAVGARTAVVAVSTGCPELQAAVRERQAARLDRVAFEIAIVPDSFVTGEETALLQALEGAPAKPTLKPPYPFERGLGGRPTLVQNVETLAHIALIARFGPEWFSDEEERRS